MVSSKKVFPQVTKDIGRYREIRAMGRPRPRYCTQVAPLGPERQLRVFVHGLDNLRSGVLGRVIFRGDGTEVPQPDKAYFWRAAGRFLQEVSKDLNRTLVPMEIEDFPNLYVGQKRTIYEKAAAELQRRYVGRRDARVRAFVKAEKLPLDTPCCRIIQPRWPVYNVAIGRYLKVIERLVYDDVGKVFGNRVIMKGMNALERGRILRENWDKFSRPVSVLVDMSRFDASVSQVALEFEHEVYGRYFTNYGRSEIDMLLSWQNVTRGTAIAPDGIVQYMVNGRRMSGDMNTALGNCLIMCMIVWTWLKGVVRFELVNDGDDCVIIIDRRDLWAMNGFEKHCLLMGFVAKISQTDVFERTEFCQSRPVLGPDGYTMVRNFPECISKDLTSIIPIADHPTPFYNHMTAIGECGGALSSGIPCLQEFYKSLITPYRRSRRGRDVRDHPAMRTGMTLLAERMHRRIETITPESRVSFYLAFGILPDEQVAYESMFRWFCPTFSQIQDAEQEQASVMPW